tara:strand:+ start:27 stop:227 length:201 start_codon:yes stop_codon:yes gene_type:complete
MDNNLNQQIGRLEASVEALQKSTDALNNDVKEMSAQISNWRGIGTILVVLGAIFGWIGTALISYTR